MKLFTQLFRRKLNKNQVKNKIKEQKKTINLQKEKFKKYSKIFNSPKKIIEKYDEKKFNQLIKQINIKNAHQSVILLNLPRFYYDNLVIYSKLKKHKFSKKLKIKKKEYTSLKKAILEKIKKGFRIHDIRNQMIETGWNNNLISQLL